MSSRLLAVRSRLLWVPVSLVLVAGALGAGWAVSQGAQQRSSLAAAFDALPASTFTIDYTSWSDIEGSLDDAGLAGLTTRSVMAPLDAEMQDVLGWATSELDWEVYGRIDLGAISALGLGEISAERVRDSFAEMGSVVDGDPNVVPARLRRRGQPRLRLDLRLGAGGAGTPSGAGCRGPALTRCRDRCGHRRRSFAVERANAGGPCRSIRLSHLGVAAHPPAPLPRVRHRAGLGRGSTAGRGPRLVREPGRSGLGRSGDLRRRSAAHHLRHGVRVRRRGP